MRLRPGWPLGGCIGVHQGVYALGHLERTSEARWMAAVTACGSGTVLSHLDAAALWGIYKGAGALVHVTTTKRSRQKRPGVRIHRARRLHPEDATVRDGIPVTTVARTPLDLTDVLGADRLLRAMREAEYLRPLELDTVDDAVQRAHGRRRIQLLKQAIAAHTPGQIVREELEHRFLELLRDAGLPAPATNVKIRAARCASRGIGSRTRHGT
jgi:predicted transcriptional regulator of viral defense system